MVTWADVKARWSQGWQALSQAASDTWSRAIHDDPGAFTGHVAAFQDQLAQTRATLDRMRNMVPNLYAPSRRYALSSAIGKHLDMALEVSPQTLTAYYRAMIARLDRQVVLSNLQVPALFVIGREDQAVPWQEALAQSVLPQQAMVELLEDTGHTSMHECPERLSGILNNFCQYVWQGKNP